MTEAKTAPRVRIAPSPTGDPHIGTAYMALFNYCFAKKLGGKFIIRIEDTDRTRYRGDSEAKLLESLKWLDLTHDEGPDIGGPFGPYRQSERLPVYLEHAEILLKDEKAYRCFCTAERLADLRKIHQENKTFGGYDRHCRNLSKTQSEEKKAQGFPFTIRMKTPETGTIHVKDELRGDIHFEAHEIDDQVLIKTDGYPTYHLAVVVDDHLMQISHIIRGEEWITSCPKHVLLYTMFGWPLPKYYHLPLLRNADKSKISKRKNPTSIIHFQNKGILPATLRNFLALSGFRPSEDQEIFSTAEMIEHFDWSRFHLGGPVFDLQKLSWLNAQYLKKLSTVHYVAELNNMILNSSYLEKVVPLLKERVTTLDEFFAKGSFFFVGEIAIQGLTIIPKGQTAVQLKENLKLLMEKLEPIEDWEVSKIQASIEAFLVEQKLKAKEIYLPVRMALTGTHESPPLFDTIWALGKERVRARFRNCISYLETV